MKNWEERPTNLDRGATQQTFDFGADPGNEDEPMLPANFLRPEVTDPAFADTPSLGDLNRYVRGWIGYFGLAQQFDLFDRLDGCPFYLLTGADASGCATGNSGDVHARR